MTHRFQIGELKEIDTFRRKSYVEQFAYLEQKFDISTLRAFPEWPEFVEMSQRRNIMTHNAGCTSAQYFAVCDREGYRFRQRPDMNQKLVLTGQYIGRTIFVTSKVAFMLAHTLWRKIFPDDVEAANQAFDSTIYEFLQRKRWRTAAEFAQFGLQKPMLKGASELHRRMRLVNTAIALKSMGHQNAAEALLDGEDWSASLREFKLAVAILKEQFADAASLMRDIGKAGEILDQIAYHRWPLFNFMRDRPEFHSAYEAIYGAPFLKKASEDVRKKTEQINDEISSQRTPIQQSDASPPA